MKINKEGRHRYPIYGRGKELVYVYYYKTYQEYAKEHGLDFWPCKIGFSATSLFNRLESQNAAFPEGIIIPFIIKTKSGWELEREIHCLLENIKPIRKWPVYKGHNDNRCYSYGGGADWYLTNPDEIYKIAFDDKTRIPLMKEILKEDELLNEQLKEQGRKNKERQKAIFAKSFTKVTDEELDALKKSNPQKYEKIMKIYEKQQAEKTKKK